MKIYLQVNRPLDLLHSMVFLGVSGNKEKANKSLKQISVQSVDYVHSVLNRKSN